MRSNEYTPPMNSMRLFVVCLVSSGCTSVTVEDLIARYRPGIEQKFKDITKVAMKAKDLPAPEGFEVVEPPVPLLLEKAKSDADNAMFIYAEDLAAPGFAETVNLRTLDSTPLLQCGTLLKSGNLYLGNVRLTPTVALGYLSACLRLRYLLVIRGKAFTAPMPGAGERSFAPGTWAADVFVFDLVTGRSLGAFPTGASNSANVDVRPSEDQQQKLLRDLEANIYDNLRAGARKAFPGSLPPPAL